MTPEVEIARLQERMRSLESEMERAHGILTEINKSLAAVDADAKRMRFGLTALAALGGIAAWAVSVWDKIAGWVR